MSAATTRCDATTVVAGSVTAGPLDTCTVWGTGLAAAVGLEELTKAGIPTEATAATAVTASVPMAGANRLDPS